MNKKTLVLETLFWSLWSALYLAFAGLCIFGGIMAIVYISNVIIHTGLFILGIVLSIGCCGPVLFAWGQIMLEIKEYFKDRRKDETR